MTHNFGVKNDFSAPLGAGRASQPGIKQQGYGWRFLGWKTGWLVKATPTLTSQAAAGPWAGQGRAELLELSCILWVTRNWGALGSLAAPLLHSGR